MSQLPQGESRAIRRLHTVDSTNREALRWAREGASSGAVVIARAQTAGRGRRGRTWISTPGEGLWFSMLLRLRMLPEQYPLLPLAAALAAADACHAVTRTEIGIKWPNDLILRGRKIAGILVELEDDCAAIGIGINVRQQADAFPLDLQGHAGSLESLTGRPVSMEALETRLTAALDARLETLDFLDEYAARSLTIGARVQVALPDAAFAGVAEGIDGTGALLVREETGALRRVLAGDVSVRGLMGYV